MVAKRIAATFLCAGLALLPRMVAAEAAPEWWHTYSTVATDPEKKNLEEIRTINADCWRAAGWYAGWYGFWFGDVLENHTDVPLRWEKVEEAGSRPMMYLDAGEIGGFAALIDEDDRQFLLNGWDWHEWEGQPGAVHWFGLQAFMDNVAWAPYKTAKDYGLPAFTYPDGSAIEPGALYDVLSRRDMQNEVRISYFTNPQITDEIARRTGLAALSERQERPPEFQQGSGWAIGRLFYQDHTNPQLAEYQQREMRYAVDRFRPNGVHIDNFGATDIWGISGSFGLWTVHTYREFLKEHFSEGELAEMGVEDVNRFDIREYTASAYKEDGVAENDRLRDDRWFSDLLFRCHLVNKTEHGVAYARGLYEAGKAAMAEAGLEGPIFGNVMPLLPSAGFMEGICDVAHFEWKSIGSYPGMPELGLPPQARIAYVTRLGEKLSNASYCWPSLYVPKDLSGASHENLHKVMAFDALANRGVMDYNHWYLDNYSPGSDASAGYVNTFIKAIAPEISGRTYCPDIGLVYCAWSNVAAIDAMSVRPERFLNEYKGWCDYLHNSHAQWDVLLSSHVTLSELSRFKAIVLPSILVVTENQASALRDYAAQGGKVIVTGETGVYKGPEGYLMPHERDVLEKLTALDEFVRVSDTPGAAYFESNYGETARQDLDALVARLDFAPILTTDASENVGVNLSQQQEDAETCLSLDLNNYDYQLETDEVTSTAGTHVTIALPAELQGNALSLQEAEPGDENGEVWTAMPESQWEVSANGGTLTIRVPSFEYFITIRIQAVEQES